MTEESSKPNDKTKEFIGYHGTSEESAKLIVESNFIPSKNHDDWLGYGVYFFIEGITCPKNNATEWAICHAWDNENKSNKYNAYSVIKVCLNVSKDKLLDLTTNDGLENFNRLREHYISKYAKYFCYGRNTADDDQKICNMAIKHLGLEALINNYYIKSKEHRIKAIHSKIANSKVILIAEPDKCIDFLSIQIIKTGVIK